MEMSSGIESDRNVGTSKYHQEVAGWTPIRSPYTNSTSPHLGPALPIPDTTSFQASIFTDVVPLRWDTRFPTFSSTVGSLTLLILQTSALTDLEGSQAPQGEPAPPSTGLQESLPFPLAGQNLLGTRVLVWLPDLVPACRCTPAPIAGTLNQSLLLGKEKDKNKLWLKLLFSSESCEDLPSPFL